jgi:glycosyltransferase involved in cell wall biosynthesis
MKISIITPTYNSAKTLSDTIESVVSQTYKDIEYIIIDGNSSDETASIVATYKSKQPITFISEPDKGIYDAMNKGVKKATGDIIGILNSDDFYFDQNVLQKVSDAFTDNSAIQAVYGDIMYVDKDNIQKKTRYWKAGTCTDQKIRRGWSMPHPALFVHRDVYQKLSYIFDTTLTIAADYDLIFRLIHINKINIAYIPSTLVYMREGGTSGRNILNRIKGWRQLRQVWINHNEKVPRFFITKRIVTKLSQYFRLKS